MAMWCYRLEPELLAQASLFDGAGCGLAEISTERAASLQGPASVEGKGREERSKQVAPFRASAKFRVIGRRRFKVTRRVSFSTETLTRRGPDGFLALAGLGANPSQGRNLAPPLFGDLSISDGPAIGSRIARRLTEL